MPKEMVNLVALLAGPLTPASAEEVVANHAAGTALIDGLALATHYAKEITARSATRSGSKTYEILASVLADYIQQSFIARLPKLAKVGTAKVMMLGSRRDSADRTKYRTVTVSSIREKLPYVVEKIRAGDLTRFVHLLTSDHVYGVCVLCHQLGNFNLLGPHPGKMRLLMDTAESEIAGAYLRSTTGYPESFGAVSGFCWKETCSPHCMDCRAMAPVRYTFEWVKSRKEDGLCPTCSSRILINTKRPVFGRHEQRRLQKLIID